MRIQIFLFFIIYQSGLFAQNITVSGYIEDMQTGERLIGASVFEALSKLAQHQIVMGFQHFLYSRRFCSLIFPMWAMKPLK